MRSLEFLKALSEALKEQKIPLRVERRLMEEYRDHLTCKVDEKLRNDDTNCEAEEKAVAEMGNPLYLANEAVETWRRNSWANRHPWLFGWSSMGFPLAILAINVGSCWVTGSFCRYYEEVHPSMIVWVYYFLCLAEWLMILLFNWGVGGAGGFWLGRQWKTHRLNARSFWTGCIFLILSVGVVSLSLQPPLEGPGSASIGVYVGLPGALLSWPIALATNGEWGWGPDKWSGIIAYPLPWLQMAFAAAMAALGARLPQDLRKRIFIRSFIVENKH